MNNRLHYILAILFFVILVTVLTPLSYAITTTPTQSLSPTISASQKNESLVQQINELKDKIASRVAQMKLVEKKGVVGTVTEVTDTRISLQTYTDEIRIIDVDEITKFTSDSSKESFGISDVSKGTVVGVIGLYNKQSKHILARYITTFTLPVFLTGTVQSVDSDNFTVTVADNQNTNHLVDVEKTTKINTYDSGDIVKSGFSKLTVGDKVDIVGYPAKDDKNRVSGSLILHIGDISTIPSPKAGQ